jgi:redox-sensing transcriptional repressor
VKKLVRPEIPRKTIYRLSIYLRCLQRLRSNAIRTVSSDALAKAAGVKPTQLRKDLTYFGQFGTRGLGDVEQLAAMIADLLGTKRLQPVVLVGVGISGARCCRIAGSSRKGLRSLRPSTSPRWKASGPRKSSSRCIPWRSWRK